MPNQTWDDRNRGVAFKNDDKTNPKWADYKGHLNIEGKEYWLDIWVREGRKGKFLSVSIRAKQQRREETPS